MRKLSQYFDYKLNGKEYKIRFKTPTVGEQISIGQTYAALKAGFPALDDVSELLAFATATLNIVVENKPSELDFEKLDSADWPTFRKMLQDYQSFAFFREETPAEPTEA
jgi:hypothetical protein